MLTHQPNTSGPRHVIGRVAFIEESGVLTYRPTSFTRTLQCVGAVGIALAITFVAFLITTTHPIRGYIDDGDSWNSRAAFCLFGIAGILLTAVPVYLRVAKTPYSIKRGSTILRHGRRLITDFQGVIMVSIMPLRVGEANDTVVYAVTLSGKPKPVQMPLLTFDHQEEAQRVAEYVSDILELPVV